MSKPEALIDKPQQVREGELPDMDRLRSYLQPVLGGIADTLEIKQFPGGYSNLTYLLSSGDEKWVMRRPPFGSKVKSAHDMGREYKVLSALEGIFPYAPQPVHFCQDHEVMGCDFYLMSYIEGLVIRKQYPDGMHLSPEEVRQQFFTLFDVLGELHSVDLEKAGLADFGRPTGYVTRQVEGWSQRSRAAMTDASRLDCLAPTLTRR